MGFDVVHFNVHKTFSTPHGGGGRGRTHCRSRVSRSFPPRPDGEKGADGKFYLDYDLPQSIGMVKGFTATSPFWSGLHLHQDDGPEGLRRLVKMRCSMPTISWRSSRTTLTCLTPHLQARVCPVGQSYKGKHEVRTLDMAKRLDYGYHANGLLPADRGRSAQLSLRRRRRRDLDEFVQAMIDICEEAKRDPETVKTAPHHPCWAAR